MASNARSTSTSDRLYLAISAIVLTSLALSLGDALIKFASSDFAIWQIFVLRSCLVLPVLVIYLAVKRPELLAIPSAFLWTVVRSLLLVGMWISYYVALPHLELSVAAAAYYTIPIFLTLFSALLIGDRVGRLGWLAVFIGFIGVLLILRPKASDFSFYALHPLCAAILYALAMILTRTKCRSVHPIMLSVALNLSFIGTGGIATLLIMMLSPDQNDSFLLSNWSPMGSAEWGAMILLALAILIGSVGAAIAYQNGPPAVVGTFDFAYVGFAVVWGVVFFSQVPDILTLVGITLIVGAGILSIRS